MEKPVYSEIFVAFILTLMVGVGQLFMEKPAFADEIKFLERKIEFLKQKKELDAQLKTIKDKLKKLDNDYSDIKNTPYTKDYSDIKNTPSTNVKEQKSSSGDFTFEWILTSLSKSKDDVVLLGFIPGKRYFKFERNKGKWTAVRTVTKDYSDVTPVGDNKLSMVGFPAWWVINGTWVFGGKTGSDCKIIHEYKKHLSLNWKCDSQ